MSESLGIDPIAVVLLGVGLFIVGVIVRELLDRREPSRGKIKTCPQCNEVVAARAEFCKTCRYHFQSDRPRGGFWSPF